MNEETIKLVLAIVKAMGSEEVAPKAHPWIGRNVLVRDHMAGVYCGTLVAMDVEQGTAELTSARQVWYWKGAAATPGIAAKGVGEGSKIGPVVDVALCEVVQVMPMTDSAYDSVLGAKVWSP